MRPYVLAHVFGRIRERQGVGVAIVVVALRSHSELISLITAGCWPWWSPVLGGRGAHLVQQLVRLEQDLLDFVSVRKESLGLDLPVQNALAKTGAHRLAKASRDITVLLRVHLDLLQEQLPNLKEAVRAVEPIERVSHYDHDWPHGRDN